VGRRRVWLIILGGAMAGYFIGGQVGKHDLSLYEYGLQLQLDRYQVALLGFGVIGAIVGAVLGAERRESAALRRPSAEPDVKSPVTSSSSPAKEAVPSEKTVRRIAGRS
jgi:hypothetical protein